MHTNYSTEHLHTPVNGLFRWHDHHDPLIYMRLPRPQNMLWGKGGLSFARVVYFCSTSTVQLLGGSSYSKRISEEFYPLLACSLGHYRDIVHILEGSLTQLAHKAGTNEQKTCKTSKNLPVHITLKQTPQSKCVCHKAFQIVLMACSTDKPAQENNRRRNVKLKVQSCACSQCRPGMPDHGEFGIRLWTPSNSYDFSVLFYAPQPGTPKLSKYTAAAVSA